MPKPPTDIVIMFSFGPHDEPHGLYGHRKRNMNTGEMEAVSLEDELRMLREYYEHSVPKHCKERSGHFNTFEKFLEYHRCNCPLHAKKVT